MPLQCRFTKIRAPPLPRSSHSLTVVKGRAYIFGGEIEPRTPVDNTMHVITLPTTGSLAEADYQAVPARPSQPGGPVPDARVGHSAAAIGDRIYIFGGRGGPDMKALDEQGLVWVFDTTTKTWSALAPDAAAPRPPARSYHTATSSPHPLPSGATLPPAPAGEPDPPSTASPSSGHGTLFIHAGCLSDGGRTGDVWSFDVSAASWSPLPSAPGPARGGTALTMVKDRLYRYGGFDGTHELGGQVDWLDLISGTFYDKGGRGEMSLAPSPAGWRSDVFADAQDPAHTPVDRSVAGFLPIAAGLGRHYLVIFGGETSPSSRGHEGAGHFLGDVWTFQLKPEGNTPASVRDAVVGVLLGWETGERQAVRATLVDEQGAALPPGAPAPMGPRGWFAADALGADVGDAVGFVVWGGIDEANRRLGDGWIVHVA